MKQKIRIKLKGYDHQLLDASVADIVQAIKSAGAIINGPIPLPTKKQYFTVLRSPHVYKESREQFQQFTHKRLLDIYSLSEEGLSSLMKLVLPSGVDILIKVF